MANKTLVAYHTKSGASEIYAKAISETLAVNGFQADLVNLKEKIADVATYDNIIVGTGVRMAMVYRRWRKVLRQKTIHDKRVYMFLSSGTAIKEPAKAVEKYVRPVVDKYGLKPLSVISFPGLIPDKWAKSEADRGTVKPDLAKAWAQAIADGLKGGH